MVWLFSMTNCTAMFLACMSVISRSMLSSRMIVGANTTARFLGDIWELLVVNSVEVMKGTYQILGFALGYAAEMEHEEF